MSVKKKICLFVLLVGMLILEMLFVRNLDRTDKISDWRHLNTSSRKEYSKPILPHINDSTIEMLQRRLENASEKKIIVIWAPAFGNESPLSISRASCGNCEVVYDKTMIHDQKARAVVFHFDTINIDEMPEKRYANQLHVFWDMESSANLMYRRFFPTHVKSYDFNATMTYRLDSDFSASYQSPDIGYQLMGKNAIIIDEIMAHKTRLAIVIISDCSILPGAQRRLQMINELKSLGLSIDTFGWCFMTHLARDKTRETIRKYKFYFAYENSYHCKDYITEKFFVNALSNDAVPVVWGALKEDYEAISPPGSFIFAEDFETPLELIQYLNYLDKSDEDYMRYFRWRTLPPAMLPQINRTRGFCALCRALHGINVDDIYNPNYESRKTPLFTDGIMPRSIPSLKYWFYGEDNLECFQTT